MPNRNGAREFAIILFCLIGIALLNDFSHNKYRGLSDPRPAIRQLLGMGRLRGYTEMDLYQLLDRYQANPAEVEGLKGVAVLGQILQERPTDLTVEDVQKFRGTFRISRRFSETGSAEGSHVLSIQVSDPKGHEYEANTWVLVQGKVKPAPGSDPMRPQPMLVADKITEQDAPLEPILRPQAPEGGFGLDEHGHEEHEGHVH
ncbi:MAG: hypothetical protein QHJ73_10885 [Armatimonadota bacterium]|nr:hypothetical protein [Armatimonadota bacterium]